MTKNHNHNQNLNQPCHKIKQNFFLRKPYPLPPLSQSKKLITNHVDVNGPTKLFLVRLINFHTRTHIVTWIALRRAERKRERERGRDSLMKRNLIKMDANPCIDSQTCSSQVGKRQACYRGFSRIAAYHARIRA